jgi:SAM-dependent methyltransferase
VSDVASARALALLRADARKRARVVDGYVDVLAQEPRSTGAVQELMRVRLVTRIYERWWRPALGRMFKGALGPGMNEEHRLARSLLELAPGDGVLDVACGPGNFTREFARAVGDTGLAVGIDASRPMLERATADGRNDDVDSLAFVLGDAVELPFKRRSFDAVCCFAALHLFSDPRRALDRMAAALTPGGRIAVFTTCGGRSTPVRAAESLAATGSGIWMFERDEVVAELERRGVVDIRQRVAGFTQFVGGRLGQAAKAR